MFDNVVCLIGGGVLGIGVIWFWVVWVGLAVCCVWVVIVFYFVFLLFCYWYGLFGVGIWGWLVKIGVFGRNGILIVGFCNILGVGKWKGDCLMWGGCGCSCFWLGNRGYCWFVLVYRI